VTDSTAYLPDDFVQEYDIHVVPLCVHFGHKDYKEGVDLSTEQFYTRLAEATELPTTSQPSAGDFYEVFKELTEAGHEVLTLTISQGLSGTWSSAMAAKRMLPDTDISVIDSRATSIGLQLMTNAAVEAISAGATRHELKELIKDIRGKISILFVVDTLEYLAKGGRIGNAKAFLGTLLKVKPILILQDGIIEPLEQVRSKRKALRRMLDLVEEHMNNQGPQAKVALAHALAPKEVQAFAQEIVDRLGCDPPTISDLGPVVGTHTGPGVIGVAAYAKGVSS
jgi:DegV family protein with EDD domain